MTTRRETILGAAMLAAAGEAAPARTVFIGNCQLAAMFRLYRDTLPPEHRDTASYVTNYASASEQDREAIAKADRVAMQLMQMEQKIGEVQTSAPVFYVPLVTGQFLWPLSGTAHPENKPYPFLGGGPYPAENGNTILNKMFADGRRTEADAAEYLALDIAKQKSVGRAYEIVMDQQRARDDRAGGYGVAGIIDAHLRDEPLFSSRGHLHKRLTQHLAMVFFSKMGIPESQMQAIRDRPYNDLFPLTEDPIHPSIAAHFGLTYATAETGYEFLYEGRFTARERAVRYLDYTWCPELAEAAVMLTRREFAAAIPLLEIAVRDCPRSETARRMLNTAREKVA